MVHNCIDVVTVPGEDFGPGFVHLGRSDFLLSCVVTVVIHHVSFRVVFPLLLKDEDTVDHQLVHEGNEQEGLPKAKTAYFEVVAVLSSHVVLQDAGFDLLVDAGWNVHLPCVEVAQTEHEFLLGPNELGVVLKFEQFELPGP